MISTLSSFHVFKVRMLVSVIVYHLSNQSVSLFYYAQSPHAVLLNSSRFGLGECDNVICNTDVPCDIIVRPASYLNVL
jgi:hypothetical protein